MDEFLKQFHLSGVPAPELPDDVVACHDANCADNCTGECGDPVDGCSW